MQKVKQGLGRLAHAIKDTSTQPAPEQGAIVGITARLEDALALFQKALASSDARRAALHRAQQQQRHAAPATRCAPEKTPSLAASPQLVPGALAAPLALPATPMQSGPADVPSADDSAATLPTLRRCSNSHDLHCIVSDLLVKSSAEAAAEQPVPASGSATSARGAAAVQWGPETFLEGWTVTRCGRAKSSATALAFCSPLRPK